MKYLLVVLFLFHLLLLESGCTQVIRSGTQQDGKVSTHESLHNGGNSLLNITNNNNNNNSNLYQQPNNNSNQPLNNEAFNNNLYQQPNNNTNNHQSLNNNEAFNSNQSFNTNEAFTTHPRHTAYIQFEAETPHLRNKRRSSPKHQSQRTNNKKHNKRRGSRTRKRTMVWKSTRSGRVATTTTTHTPPMRRLRNPRTRSLEHSNSSRDRGVGDILIAGDHASQDTLQGHVETPSHRSSTSVGQSTPINRPNTGLFLSSHQRSQPRFRHYRQFFEDNEEREGTGRRGVGWEVEHERGGGGGGGMRQGHGRVWGEESQQSGSTTRRNHHHNSQQQLMDQSSSQSFSIPETIVKDGKVFYRYDAGGVGTEEDSREHRRHSGSDGREDDIQSQSKRSHDSQSPSIDDGYNRPDNIPVDILGYINSGTDIPNNYVSAQAHTIASPDGGLSHAVVTGNMPGTTGMATAGHGNQRAEAWVHTGPHAVSRAQVSSPPGTTQLTAEVNAIPDGSIADAWADAPSGGTTHTHMDFSPDTHDYPTHGLASAIVTPEGGSTLASLGGEAGQQGSYFGSAISASSSQSQQQPNSTHTSLTHIGGNGSSQTHSGEEIHDIHDESQPTVELSHDMLGSIMEVVHQPQMVPEVAALPPPPPPFVMDRDGVLGGSGTPPRENEVEQVPQTSMEEGVDGHPNRVGGGQVGEVTYFKGELGPSPELDDLPPQPQYYDHYDYYSGIPSDGMQYYDPNNLDGPDTPYFEMGHEIFPVGPLHPVPELSFSTPSPADLYTDITFSTPSPPPSVTNTPDSPILVHQAYTTIAYLPSEIPTHHPLPDPLWSHQPTDAPSISPQPTYTVSLSNQPTPGQHYPRLPSSGHLYPDQLQPNTSTEIRPSTEDATDQVIPSSNATSITSHSGVGRDTVHEAGREGEEIWRETDIGTGREIESETGRMFGAGGWRETGTGGLGREMESGVGMKVDRGVVIVPGAVGTTHSLPNGADGPTLNVMTVAAVRGMVAQRAGVPISPGGKIPGAPGYRVPEGFRGHVVLGHDLPVETGSRRVLPGFNTQVRLDPEGMSGPVFASVSGSQNPRHQPGGTTGVHVTLASRGGRTHPTTTSTSSRGNYWSGVGGRPEAQNSQTSMARSTSARQSWNGGVTQGKSWNDRASSRQSWETGSSGNLGRCAPYTMICNVVICC
ncbi:hypothetical protein Pmani_002826 [Petrolisthes manimaculis]|uniref:Uncharacterized protein n=1 Tax=Petrolisthes manimaculis TaxID=1843537 RepID=A0AAE1QK65_9EUCA|nr:hypothetical protein Pmani_002826 [Petrolisthes manimaculis]